MVVEVVMVVVVLVGVVVIISSGNKEMVGSSRSDSCSDGSSSYAYRKTCGRSSISCRNIRCSSVVAICRQYF